MKRLALVFLFVLSAASQSISVGVLGGVPLIDQTNTNGNPFNYDESRPYIVGPSVEARLPAGFVLEADALYQRVGNSFSYELLSAIGTGFLETTSLSQRTRANVWEFPLLGKYYFRRDSAWQPFVGTGFAFRTTGIGEAGAQTILNTNGVSSTFPFTDNFRSDLEVGATVAAGIRYRMGRVALQPQVRYTRWGGSNSVLRRDEAAFFLGISF